MTQSSISTPPETNNIAKPGMMVKYYHNALLKECTYRKPDVLKKMEQAINDPPPDSRKC